MGTVFVDNLEPQSGTSLTLGASGDTVGLASGASQTLAVNTPAFFVFKNSNMSEISHLTATKITFGNEDLDTDNAFDSSSNYRFTPQTAGKYVIGLSARLEQNDGNASNLEEAMVHIYKNGSVYAEAKYDFDANEIKSFNPILTAIVDLNGSSDYVEGFFTIHTSANSNGRLVGSSNRATYMYGYKLLGA
tara:strand:- start:320 stop:889 length:570 start_codon:yes stop_codon:yes gene_type:complete